MTDSAQENLNSKRLARNIRHRLADMLGSQWTGALDWAMDEMLLDEIEKFSIIQIPIKDSVGLLAQLTPEQRKAALDYEGPVASGVSDLPRANPHRKRDEDGDPYLKGIMERD